jgi:hypothetical protein
LRRAERLSAGLQRAVWHSSGGASGRNPHPDPPHSTAFGGGGRGKKAGSNSR